MESQSIVRHVFKKHHFPKPTWCSYCGDFIWGLGKQGYFCPSCEYGVHKKCLSSAELSRCEKHEKKPLTEMSAAELETFIGIVEKREQRLNQLQEDLQRKRQKLEEETRKFEREKRKWKMERDKGTRDHATGVETETKKDISRPILRNKSNCLVQPDGSVDISMTKSMVSFNRSPVSPKSNSGMRRILSTQSMQQQDPPNSVLSLFNNPNNQSGDMLRKILSNMHARHAFRMFVVADFREELILFVESVEKYRQTNGPRRVQIAAKMYRKYFADSAKLKLNIPVELGKDVVEQLSAVDDSSELSETEVSGTESIVSSVAFDQAYDFTMEILRQESLGRFLQSDLCIELVRKEFFSDSSDSSEITEKFSPELRAVDHQRLICKVDRIMRQRFIYAVAKGDFPTAMEIFEQLRDSGALFVKSAYQKSVFFLKNIALPNELEDLVRVVQKDGHSLREIEEIMKAFKVRLPGDGIGIEILKENPGASRTTDNSPSSLSLALANSQIGRAHV